MNNYAKSVIPIIEANYENFTPMEKIIADFFINNKGKHDFSAKAVSKALYVSEASLSRFSQKCGFRGYREFIFQYQEFHGDDSSGVTSHTKTVLDAYQELLNKTYNLLDEVQVKRVCAMIHKATKIYIYGKGSSGIVAREVKLRFMRIGLNVDAISDGDLMRMQTVLFDKDTLIIGLSMSGESRDIAFVLREARKRNSRTILVTARNNQEQDNLDEQVLVASRENLDYGNMISPQFPILVMIDLIYSYVLDQDKRKRETYHQETINALKEKKNENY